ncbi:MAG TPA: DUF1018 domain-containing protein [Candidatus Ozemobacteraceae bacterium]|nr:DUF1018 domain-containing protein [Candidatus Ozemobacteraceae bacterium]
MASKEQIKTIHVLINALRIEDDVYRGLLEGYGVASSKDLSFDKAAALISRLATDAQSAGVWTPKQGPKRYEHLDARSEEWASPAQLRLIEGLWNDVSYMSTQGERRLALRRFVEKRFGFSALEFIPAKSVRKIVQTFEAMKAENDRKKTGGKAA